MRADGRKADELRRIKITRNYIKSAEGSVLIEMGIPGFSARLPSKTRCLRS